MWALMTSSASLWRISLIDGEKRPVDGKSGEWTGSRSAALQLVGSIKGEIDEKCV